MADSTNDAFNGYVDSEELLEQAYAKADAQAVLIQQLQADLSEARNAAVTWAQAYLDIVEALGYEKEDWQTGKIKHEDVVKYARACDTGDFV